MTKIAVVIVAVVAVVIIMAVMAQTELRDAGYSEPNPGDASPPSAPAPGDVETGHASYYADDLVGRSMANGEPYRADLAVCAHRTHPFGAKLRVTNLENGRTVHCTVADRGPFVEGRIVDLSRSLAESLDMLGDGVVPVEVRRVP